jgi:hypothetical protein
MSVEMVIPMIGAQTADAASTHAFNERFRMMFVQL